jgi:septal ring factor EnvC (AmiA/AmiB activator)
MIKFSNEARRKMTDMLAKDQLKIDELDRERVELKKKLEALERKIAEEVDRRNAVMNSYGIFLDYSTKAFELLDNY